MYMFEAVFAVKQVYMRVVNNARVSTELAIPTSESLFTIGGPLRLALIVLNVVLGSHN